MDLFVLCAMLVAILPLLFTARGWWVVAHDPLNSSGRLAPFVLVLNSATAMAFFFTILLATREQITQVSVGNIGAPNFFLCFGITVLSVAKIRHKVYRAVLVSSGLLTVGWLIAVSLH